MNSLFGGAVLTLIFAVGAILLLMATTPEVDVRKEGLFGAVFFSSASSPDGSIGMSLGIGSWESMVAFWLVCSVFVCALTIVVTRLRRYRASLIAQANARRPSL
ncbi:hypothetical protein ACLH0K_13870 [Arthrobacter sp. MPF02]|uniref:hypothetical protein n=1 Tax=Arthrobacter sp. MPF02 TaxID=3388492 RepID=UPI003984C717